MNTASGAREALPNEVLGLEFEVCGPRSAADREIPAVAGGISTFMTAWEHDRDGGTNIDIHGRIVRYPAYIPMLLLLE